MRFTADGYRPKANLNDGESVLTFMRSFANPVPCSYCQRYESATNCLDHDYHDRQRRVVRGVVSQ
ncbi:hypothetical protein EMIT0194MI4_40479 [Pseudomonas sp. IT-194MI4]